MQARNPPHCLTFPAGNAGATQCQKDGARCCGWLSLCYIRYGVPTAHNFYHGVGGVMYLKASLHLVMHTPGDMMKL